MPVISSSCYCYQRLPFQIDGDRGESRMYIFSRELTERIMEISREADIQSGHVLLYEEFIALPCFGQIILRFSLNKEDYTLEDLDQYETMLNRIAGNDFLCDFMGSVYRKAGVDYSGLEQRMIQMNDQFADELILPSSHSAGIAADAALLLKAAGLPADRRVWEIQPEGDEYLLLLMGEENRPVMSIADPVRLSVAEADERSCTGLIRAALYCRRNHISLVRVLLNKREKIS